MIQRRRAILALVLAASSLAVAPPPREDPEEKPLRAARQAILDAFDKGDIDAVLVHLHPDVVMTFQNAETVRGRDGVRQFYEKMLAGDHPLVVRLTTHLKSAGRSRFYNDRKTAVTVGEVENQIEMKDGKSFKLESRWTTTWVKEKDGWQVVAFQIGSNIFDNGAMKAVLRTTIWWTGIGIAVVGAMLGAFGGAMFRRRSPA
jgi:ketosteroid isomerase-like protein